MVKNKKRADYVLFDNKGKRIYAAKDREVYAQALELQEDQKKIVSKIFELEAELAKTLAEKNKEKADYVVCLEALESRIRGMEVRMSELKEKTGYEFDKSSGSLMKTKYMKNEITLEDIVTVAHKLGMVVDFELKHIYAQPETEVHLL